jgi:multidrug transporter EmrE-like cation transporter
MGYLFVALTVLLTISGQLLIKWQVNLAGPLPAHLDDKALFLVGLVFKPWMVIALCAGFAGTLCWMVALTKLPLSQAYPFTAITFVIVSLGGAWLFSEPLTLGRIVGVILIAVGIILTAID